MCRWLAYSGAPLSLAELIFNTTHSLIQQSRHSREAETTTNADGFGVGWYGNKETPGVYHSMLPAWNDHNLHEIAYQMDSPLFLAHVRAATGTQVQLANCHPFRYDNWLFVHNGIVRGLDKVRRDLMLAVDPDIFPNIHGTTDSELLFHLALTFGLMDEPLMALERMAGFVETVGKKANIDAPIQMSLGISDGKRIYGVRYSSERSSNSLFHTRPVCEMREDYPPVSRYSDDARALVSEPLTDNRFPWIEVPESTALIIEKGEITELPFKPRKL